jgi:DNA (cytosine-5)-methyltransferase 1
MVKLKYGSVCSGVEAATVAWHDLGFEPQWFSEVDAFPSAVLQHHYPNVPNHGDMTKFKEWNNDKTIDLLVGGTPCQSFSVAGLRQGLSDPRGNLMLTYLAMAEQLKPKWLVWENVPGVLSSNRGRDFATFLTAMGKIGYGFAYRVLDAQYFGVPQRRRRVFVVGCLGDWRSAASVLFEPESLSGHPAPSREERQRVAPTVSTGPPFSRTGNSRVEADALVTYALPGNWIGRKPENGGNQVEPFVELSPCQTATDVHAVAYEHHAQDSRVKELPEVCSTVTAKYGTGGGNMPIVATSYTSSSFGGYHEGVGTVRASGGDLGGGSETLAVTPKSGSHWDGDFPHPTLTQSSKGSGGIGASNQEVFGGRGAGLVAKCLTTRTGQAYDAGTETLVPTKATGETTLSDVTMSLTASYGAGGADLATKPMICTSAVRRLTPRECERLQGFPDDYTQISWRGKEPEDCPNGHRYKAMGNSMAVPVMRWIGERIQMVEEEKL